MDDVKICDYDTCQEDGLYRAPKSRDLSKEFFYFCLDHIRDYNKSWDYFSGMTGAEIRAHQISDITWRRPTWSEKKTKAFFFNTTEHPFFNKPIGLITDSQQDRAHIPLPKRNSSEAAAMKVLDIPNLDSHKLIKKRYLSLVKTYHPDKNSGCQKSENKLKKITVAYQTLSKYLRRFQTQPLRR